MELADNEKGVLQLPLGLALFAILFAGIGIWSFLSHWRGLSDLQLKLDRCVGETAQDLRDLMNSVESGNARMIELRAGISVAGISPAVASALRATLIAEATAQELRRAKWKFKQLTWLGNQGCDHIARFPSSLPNFPWIKDPPDAIGPRPLRAESSDLHMSLSHPPRWAAAKIVKGNEDETKTWIAEWTNIH